MIYPDPPKKISKTMKKFLRNKYKNKFKVNSKINEKAITGEVVSLEMDFESQSNYVKQTPDKNVSFNTQVMIIHFTGDVCVGQSIEELSKEKDQQARYSERRKTFLTKYDEFWPTKK
ncbi:unnamed protein product [Parnassius apollo]|uniref:(apollo) hypothetical protein n=1 Tax=Parnassius apollo TaxID=110799 RepID=A0A8S3XIR5_PARAO|nr:unnamed protein product [Parnassius apollo]